MLCSTAKLSWPPPKTISVEGFDMTRQRFSQITDLQRAEMSHVVRGAIYRPINSDCERESDNRGKMKNLIVRKEEM